MAYSRSTEEETDEDTLATFLKCYIKSFWNRWINENVTVAANFIQMILFVYLLTYSRSNSTKTSPACQHDFPTRTNHKWYYIDPPWFIRSAVFADFAHFYRPFSSLLTKMAHLKFKNNLGLLKMDTDISTSSNVSECLVNTIIIPYFLYYPLWLFYTLDMPPIKCTWLCIQQSYVLSSLLLYKCIDSSGSHGEAGEATLPLKKPFAHVWRNSGCHRWG